MYRYIDEGVRPKYTCWICIRWLNRRGKVKAMRAFRMVSAARLENVLQANENNFDDILAHIADERKHPPGRHWVNNLLMSTLLAHQFLRAEREETGSSNNCALNVWYYTSSVRVTSIMLAISPGTCWRCGTFYLTLPRPTSLPGHMSVTIVTP